MLDKEQLGIVRGSVAALAVAVAAIGGGYIWVAPQWFGLTNGLAISCSIPDDHISPRRSALFMARSVLRELRDGGQPC